LKKLKKIAAKIAIIPARSGSRRIKDKNIKIFNKKPIIYWSIKAAKESKIFDRIIVSTDSKKIAKISNRYGAETPFIRKKKLAQDITSTVDVVRDAIKNSNIYNAKVCCIYPCAPLISPKDLIKAYKKLSKKVDFVFSSSTFSSDIFNSFYFSNKNKKVLINNKKLFYKGRKNKKIYHDAGQFYWGHKKSWVKKKEIFDSKVDIIEIPRWRSQDINHSDDWETALKLSKII
tara:strand:+ start:115 stop:807 length:693 start_codon:yes stop_codon:yes gene_type:complete